MPRAPDSFRAELSLPHEEGFQERWYAGRILIAKDWVIERHSKGNDIVMQWHAIPGKGKATFPNLEISVGGDSWYVRRSFGTALENPTRTNDKLAEPIQPGTWVSWVIHAKWSPREDGLIQIWKDGKVVHEKKGPNVYGDIGVEYTPYLKTGIYHPEWHLDKDRKRAAFEADKPDATSRTIYGTDYRVADGSATYEEVAPK
ncbi:MAG: polysaccharide lyase [Luteolibacter sp.]